MNVREQFLSWGMVGAYVILNSFGALAIKHTVHHVGVADPTSMKATVSFFTATLLSPLVLLGLFAVGLSACAWIVALSRMELSTAYPVAVALNCLIVVTTGLAAYGETLNCSKLAGIGLLLCSLVMLFRG
jgi:multidrug transporter EmrE-like cation transporter